MMQLCTVYAQSNSSEHVPNLTVADRASRRSISFPFSLIVPEGVRLGYDLREYIASSEFGRFDSIAAPEAAFDEIYFEALSMAHGDRSTAMLAGAIASFEHEYIPFNFFGSELDVPLTGEDHAGFLVRVLHLPAHLYHTPEGDRDKLQHFFGSAWLKSVFGMDWFVHLAGEAVEAGETLFLVGESRDPRDIHANADGLRFELQAEQNRESKPSSSLTPNP
jgi:hypothetical protein